jgi:hypothetical protein
MTVTACTNDKVQTPTDSVKIPTLPNLVDYSTSATYYNPTAVVYTGDVKIAKEELLANKIKEEKENTGYNSTTFTWNEDVSTVRKIFTLSSAGDILNRFAKAALKEQKMSLLVDYIVRTNTGNSTPYELEIGKGDFLNDYDELDQLNDIYDDDDEAKITIGGKEKFITEVLRLKEYKMMGELAKIFGDSGDELARTAVEMVAYSQEVVDVNMREAYEEATEKDYIPDTVAASGKEFDFFMKEIIFDYEILSYYKAFNKNVLLNDSYEPTDRQKMVQLYGWHYLYQLKDYLFWSEKYTRSNYEEYLALGVKDYFDTPEEALKYTKYDREHYIYAYRYTSAFYETYHNAHFTFQNDIEVLELTVYQEKVSDDTYIDMGYAISSLTAATGGKTYSEQMKTAISAGRMEAILVMSDVNYEYTGVEANVKAYQQKSKAYLSLSERIRDDIEGDRVETTYYVEHIKYVEYQVERIKPQTYFLSHSKVETAKSSAGIYVANNIVLYQIYSYNADTIRGMQSIKKENVVLSAEIAREEKRDERKDSVIAQKTDEKGRNEIITENITTNYGNAGITSQIDSAKATDFNQINRDLTSVQSANYNAYHNEYTSGQKKRYEDWQANQVSTYFDDWLIKRKWVAVDDNTIDIPEEDRNESNGYKKEYDTSWSISRFLNEHETIMRYANNQVKITYNYLKNIGTEFSLEKTTATQFVAATDFTITTTDNYVTWECAAFPTNSTAYTGVFSGAVTAKPGKTKYAMHKEETLDSGDKLTIAIWDLVTNGFVGVGKPTAITITTNKNGYVNSKGEQYYFEFVGWFIDADFKYIVRPDDKFDYDMQLYPAFYITRTK